VHTFICVDLKGLRSLLSLIRTFMRLYLKGFKDSKWISAKLLQVDLLTSHQVWSVSNYIRTKFITISLVCYNQTAYSEESNSEKIRY
jgi:hypothetical protein